MICNRVTSFVILAWEVARVVGIAAVPGEALDEARIAIQDNSSDWIESINSRKKLGKQPKTHTVVGHVGSIGFSGWEAILGSATQEVSRNLGALHNKTQNKIVKKA